MNLTQVLFVPRTSKKKPRKPKPKPSILLHPIYSSQTSSPLDPTFNFNTGYYPIDKFHLLGLNINTDQETINLAEEAFFIYINTAMPTLIRKGWHLDSRCLFLVAAVWAWGCYYINTNASRTIFQLLEVQLAIFVRSQCDLPTLDNLQAYRLTYLLTQVPNSPLHDVAELCYTSVQCLMFSLVLGLDNLPEMDPILAVERQLLAINYGFQLNFDEQFNVNSSIKYEFTPVDTSLLLSMYTRIPADTSLSYSHLALDHIALSTATCHSHLIPILTRIRTYQSLHPDKLTIKGILNDLNSVYQQTALLVSDIGIDATPLAPTQPIDYTSYMLVLDFIFEAITLKLIPSTSFLLSLSEMNSDSTPTTQFWWEFYIEVNTRLVQCALRLHTRLSYTDRIPILIKALNHLINGMRILPKHHPLVNNIESNINKGLQLCETLQTSPGILSTRVQSMLPLLLPIGIP